MTQVQNRPKPEVEARTGEGGLWQVFLIFVASAYAPFMAYVTNHESPSLVTAVTITAVVTALGLAARWAMIKAGLDPLGSSYAVSLFIALAMNSGPLVEKMPGGAITVLALIVLIAVIGYRLRHMRIVSLAMAFGAFALAISPLAEGIAGASTGEYDLNALSVSEIPPPLSTPDVVVVVADGYPAERVLRDLYAVDNSQFYEELESQGFVFSHDAVANYPFTIVSVSNTMMMDYVAGEQAISRSDANALYDMLGGSNRMAEWLTGNGYEHTYVESGWLGTSCTSEVDECVGSLWPDEAVYDVAARSVLRGASGFEVGRSFGRGTLHSIEWLDTDLEPLLANGEPDYIYVHLLAPHPPLFLAEDCALQPSMASSGFTMARPGADEAELEAQKEAFRGQVECVNTVLSRVSDLAASHEAVMLAFGDHGTDLGGQLYTDGTEWSAAQRWERFRPLVAARGEGCDFQDIGSLVNLGRRVVACLSEEPFADVPDVSFTANRDWELEATTVPETSDG